MGAIMFADFEFETLTPRLAALFLGLALGGVFGILAQRTRFCLRRTITGEGADRRAALGVWVTALATALIGTQAAVAQGWISFADHRLMTPNLPIVAIVVGGLMFGAGMILTRGCTSRLTILGASGNLRALWVVLLFAVVAHATLKGALAPLRTTLGSVTLPLGDAVSLAALPGGAVVWTAVLAAAALAIGLRSGARPAHLIMAAVLGLLVPAGWVGTGFVLFDDFDPIAMESLSFTLPATETLFWTIASTSVPAGFGVGLIGGTLAGAFAAAVITREFAWQSFTSPAQTGRYSLGAAMMGMGAVLAGGCTIGAGLAGVPTLSVAALLTLASIILGGVIMHATLNRTDTVAIPAE